VTGGFAVKIVIVTRNKLVKIGILTHYGQEGF